MEPRRIPTCRDCGSQHFNFQECPPAEPVGHMRAAAVIRQPRKQRDWKTRARTVQIVPGNVVQVLRKRTHSVSGRVTDQDGKPMQQPALAKFKPTLVYPEEVNNG